MHLLWYLFLEVIMELYKQEFCQDFDLGFDLNDHPYLIDKSWHNDLCPSFYFKVGEQYYVLWVDYAESPRVCQRLNNLRNWNYEKIKSLYIRIS